MAARKTSSKRSAMARAPAGYAAFLADVKHRVRAAQVKAALAVNAELVLLYWSLGRDILARQQRAGWGAQVIDRLSADLRAAFPEMAGFSPRNLKYMRAFAAAWPEETIVQGPLAQLTWYNHVTLLEKVAGRNERLWYARQAIEHGWSRNVLLAQIETRLHQRAGKALTNFATTLPPARSELAQQTLKDPYIFDFLTLGPKTQERDLERGLVTHVRDFLLELGVGFAFVGSQVHLEVGGKDYYLDLLFFHLRLRCFVVIDLKTGAFEPEYAGKMNFYLSAVDAQLRHEGDQPSIGLILCKENNRVIVEYALRDTSKPIGVSAYRLMEKLPRKLAGSLPTVEALEAELGSKAKKKR